MAARHADTMTSERSPEVTSKVSLNMRTMFDTAGTKRHFTQTTGMHFASICECVHLNVSLNPTHEERQDQDCRARCLKYAVGFYPAVGTCWPHLSVEHLGDQRLQIDQGARDLRRQRGSILLITAPIRRLFFFHPKSCRRFQAIHQSC